VTADCSALARLVAHGFGRLEAPMVLDDGTLVVSDITKGGVHAVNPVSGARRVLVEHRKGIGGICAHVDGLVVTGRNVSLRRANGESSTLLEPDAVRGITGFNDMTVDSRGRIYVGALGFTVSDGWEAARPGCLYCIDVDGCAEVLDEDLLLPNGMAFSPDGARYYQSDSLRKLVWAYSVGAHGELGPRELFANIPEGLADGIAVSADGSVWVAAAYAGTVFRFDAQGRLVDAMKFASPMVTSVCFTPPGTPLGMYVTTGPEDADPQLEGAIFELPVDVAGVARHMARVLA